MLSFLQCATPRFLLVPCYARYSLEKEKLAERTEQFQKYIGIYFPIHEQRYFNSRLLNTSKMKIDLSNHYVVEHSPRYSKENMCLLRDKSRHSSAGVLGRQMGLDLSRTLSLLTAV